MHYQPKQDLLEQRIILVTGAGDGIGREAALTYARFGAQLVLLGRTESKLLAVQQEIAALGGAPALVVTLDLLHATQEQCRQIADDLARQIPRLDGVLHNAGLLGDIAPMADLSITMWQEVMQVNVNATLYADSGAAAAAAEIPRRFTGVHQLQRRAYRPRRLGCLCGVEVRHRGHDAGVWPTSTKTAICG
ncbi:Uncharacterized oxidoreductase yciK [Serratia marcescens]|uniref:Uncharacterized oxidoreductase yciK n=1 Tax=Serratia marcescens TaxID=615 RepID=A0A379ZF64_SERMA|nr:Uncharacterized oxidoreductase yciK [Serratia marcescens]